MKKLTYVCDDCEDTEQWEEVLRPGFHCECGGHLHLKKRDNFIRNSDYRDCQICENQDTDNCVDCNHEGKSW